jgi:Secretion system C-terminal sorting domain
MKKFYIYSLFALFFISTQLTARTFSLPYFDNFETGAPGWYQTTNSPNCAWELGYPNFGQTTGAFSGTNCWDINLNSAYVNNAECILYSPNFDFTGTYQADISFWVNYNMERIFDLVLFQYTLNHGDSWNYLNIPGMYNNDGMSAQWTKASITTNIFAGYSQVVFRFIFISDGSITLDGYSIDDFRVKGQTVGLTDDITSTPIAVFPNPSTGLFQVSVSQPVNNGTLQVVDSKGMIIASEILESKNSFEIDLRRKEKGVYFILIRAGDIVETRRVVISN